MSTPKQAASQHASWLIPSLEKAVRTSIAGGAVAMMAMAAHASVGETASPDAGPTFTSALQMSIGFCALALALYRRNAVVEEAIANDAAIGNDEPRKEPV